MSINSAPARYANACPSPVPSENCWSHGRLFEAASGENHGFGAEDDEVPTFPPKPECSGDFSIFQHQVHDAAFQQFPCPGGCRDSGGSDQFQPGPVADMGKPGYRCPPKFLWASVLPWCGQRAPHSSVLRRVRGLPGRRFPPSASCLGACLPGRITK